ncbi:HK97 gp10 family phage protein [Sphingomonas zeae]
MRPTIRITGTDEIARKIRAMGKALARQTLIPIMADNVEPIADNMRSLARRRTGAMAESVTVSTKLSPHQAAIVEPIAPIEIYAGPGPLPQAIQEEFGNVHEAPHPFIRPAFDSGVKRAVDGIAHDGIDAILDAAKKG